MTEVRGTSPDRSIPGWVGIVLAGLCVLGGLAFAYWVFHDSLPGGSDFIADPNVARGGARRRPQWRQQVQPDGIVQRGSRYMVRSGQVAMQSLPGRDGKMMTHVFYLRRDVVTPEQMHLLLMRGRLLSDAAAAQFISLTPQQRKQLNAIPRLPTMGTLPMVPLPQSEIQGLESMLEKWRAQTDVTAKAAAEKDLLAAIKNAGDKNLAATRANATKLTDQIKAVLTPEQLDKFRSMGNGPAPGIRPPQPPPAPVLRAPPAPPAPPAAAAPAAPAAPAAAPAR